MPSPAASPLGPEDLESFERDGYVALRGAVPTEVIDRCRADVATVLRTQGVDVDDPGTWTRPVVRINCPLTAPFVEAGTQPVLWAAYDQLLGEGTWVPLRGVGGTIPVRFPHPDDPGDAGWHVDGGFAGPDGLYWLDLTSRGRGLLVLFLIDDVGPDDAPAELLVGSHLDLPAVLAPHGADGASFLTVAAELTPATLERPSAFATGRAGVGGTAGPCGACSATGARAAGGC